MEKTIIVDGYNVIYSKNPKIKELEAARNMLIQHSKLFRGKKIIIVFDGKLGVSSNHETNVIFTKGESADDYIKRFVRDSKTPNHITVVTRDKSIIGFVKSIGASVMSPSEFLQGPKEIQKRKETIMSIYLEKGVLTPHQVRDINSELAKLWDIDDQNR